MSTVDPRWIIVDDVDSQIQYTGPWFAIQGSEDSVGNFGPPYLSTMHGTNSNASLSFAFNGTGVKVIGSNNILNDSGVLDPTWECFIDNINIGATSPFEFPENNWEFCPLLTPLVDGAHILTVNATVLKNQTFWIDNIQYVPSASVSLDEKVIVVDHLDPELQYGQGWQSLGETANMTTVPGSIFLFDFIGISLSWYGFIPVELPKGSSPATYSIDGQTPVSFLLKGLSASDTTTIYNQKFFETAQLTAGSHTLKAVFEGNNSTPLTLTSLIVQNGTVSSTSTSATTTSVLSSATSSIPGSVVSVTSVAARSSTPVGGVVGGVIGGLALIFFVIFGLLFLHRRHKRAKQEQILISKPEPFGSTPVYPSSITQTSSPSVVTSYSPSSQTTQMGVPVTKGRVYHASMPSLATTSLRPVPFHQTTLSTADSSIFPPSESSPSPSRKAGTLASAPVRNNDSDTRLPGVVLHADSGIRMPSSTAGTSVVDVPPLYTLD